MAPGESATACARPGWRRESGCAWPAGGAWRWLRDPQALAATLAALPVWAALGSTGAALAAPASAPAWLSLVLVQPLAEELVFRGLLQGQLLRLGGARRIGGLTLANLATTGLFVLLHLPTQPAAWALAVAVPSLVFGHLRERFASVLPAVALHAYYNAGFGLLAWSLRG